MKHLLTILTLLLFATSAWGQGVNRDTLPINTGGGVTAGVPFEHDDNILCTEPNCEITAEPGPAGPQSIEVCEDTDFTLGGNPDCLTWTAPSNLPSDAAVIALGKYTSPLNGLTSDFPNGAWWGTEVLYTPLLPVPVDSVVDLEVSIVI